MEIYCQAHHQLIESLLVDVTDMAPIRAQDGRVGMLTEVFLNQFGWNSSGN